MQAVSATLIHIATLNTLSIKYLISNHPFPNHQKYKKFFYIIESQRKSWNFGNQEKVGILKNEKFMIIL